jgi:two-component system, OmpR family, KDP operon response regulator KdpE
MKKQGARVLVVEDEREIVRLLQRILTAQDFQVFTTTCAVDILEELAHYRPDLLLLGLDGTGKSGLAVCQQVRAQSGIPIIVLSGSECECDKVRALDLGADDYVCKPFGVLELVARVRVALRHAARPPCGTEPMVTAGPLTVDVARRLVLFNGQEVLLTPTEYDLLKVLITHRDNILSKQSLLAQVWGTDYGSDSHCLHVYIAQLRRKIEVDPSRPRLIVNVPGVGYRLVCDQERSA